MKTEMVAIDRLIPYARNPRNNANAVDAIAASIKEFGFRQPIVVDEDMVILVGHTRHKAAQKLGLKDVPVHIATGMTETQKKAYRIADNRTNEIAEWDNELLALELEDLRMEEFDLGMLAFEEEDLNQLLTVDNQITTNSIDTEQKKMDTGINYVEQFSIVVMCKDEKEQEELYLKLTHEGLSCKVLVN